jgi:glucosamine-6-phosphate deaminase
MVDSFEKIPCAIFPDPAKGSLAAAQVIAQLIRDKQARNERCVLGLATGLTPKSLYAN